MYVDLNDKTQGEIAATTLLQCQGVVSHILTHRSVTTTGPLKIIHFKNSVQ